MIKKLNHLHHWLLDDLSGVPGLMTDWSEEIKRRKKEIVDFTNVTFAKKASRLLGIHIGRAESLARISGVELLDIISPNLKKNHSTKILSNNPTNCNERSYLVSYILKWSGKRGKDLSFLQMRFLLIHATLANAFEERSLESLVALYQIYLAYIEKLLIQLERASQYTLQNNHRNACRQNISPAEKKILLNKNVVTAYKVFAEKRVPKVLREIKALHLDNQKIKQLKNQQTGAEEKKNKLFYSAYYTVSIMRCFPMLQMETEEIANLILALDDQHPLGWFLKGEITAAGSELKFDEARAGYERKERQELMLVEIKATLESYGKALACIQQNQYEGLNYIILTKYVAFILFVCRFINAPRSWKISYLEKALAMLQNAQSHHLTQILKMQSKIEDMILQL